ncbi:MAG: Ig-like domain-containing protein [Candidatus Sericytochromatia bacterium]|nr:Ig-like domain-containing protein [Candidatus Sericytochromatia bacterium]
MLNDLSKAAWSSGNTSVATISAAGTIFGVSVGTTTMTVTYGGFSYQFTVEVKANT